MDDITSAIAACFGNEMVPDGLAKRVRAKLPFATFVRASLRCGSGLFVTEDLLRPGAIVLTMVSLSNSMAGLAMKQGRPVSLGVKPTMARRWPPDADSTQQVVCYPVGVQPAGSGGGSSSAEVSYIGALQVGLSGPLPSGAHAELERLACALGPYLLLISLTKLQDMSKMMQLPLGECSCCAGEEGEEEDAPFGRCMEDLGPGSGPGGAAPSQTAANLAAPGAQQQQQQGEEEQRQRQGKGAAAQSAAAAALAAAQEALAAAGAGAGPAAEEEPQKPEQQQQAERQQEQEQRLGLRRRGGPAAAPSPPSHPGSSDEPLKPGKAAALPAADFDFDGFSAGPDKAKAQQQLGQGMHAGHAVGEEEEEDEYDPKAAARRASARAAAAGLRQGVLLNFLDPAMEARFRQEQARDVFKLDLLFHLVYLVAFTCTTVLDPQGVLGAPTNIWLGWILALPAVTIMTFTDWYMRWRSWLLVPLTLLHMAHYRFAAAPSLLQSLPTSALRKLPWLLRCTGAEALLVFPLGNKLPFSSFLPVQLASVAIMLTLLPGPCQAVLALLPSAGCLPSGWATRCAAALVGAGLVLPCCAIYFAESRARSQFAHSVRNGGMQPALA